MLAAILTNLDARRSTGDAWRKVRHHDRRIQEFRRKDSEAQANELQAIYERLYEDAPQQIKQTVKESVRQYVRPEPQTVVEFKPPQVDWQALIQNVVVAERLLTLYEQWLDDEEAITALLLSF